DRGIDVFASPDGLGLQEPRIFVEVKHRRRTRIGAPDIRTFLGGRQPGDKCLFVSTGGFAREAKYEAERSSIPIRLLDLQAIRELVIENYESFSTSAKNLLPLERFYWPI
ncbi:MAG: restriction endonuclease, partial [Planctomycetota bacterium]